MLEIGKVYRLSKKGKNPDVIEVDGLPNFFHETAVPHAGTQFEVQRGIHVFAKVKGSDGRYRIPMIFITSSPYKAGSIDTPWKDCFDPDHGCIRYYGDNKSSKKDPEDAAGNRTLLKLMQVYQSNDAETRANEGVPLLYFERVTVDGRVKGNLKFQGFGIATAAELVTQFTQDQKSGNRESFLNYQFNLVVFSLKQEREKFDFVKWIGARYDIGLTAEETNQYAPKSWQDWIGSGTRNLTKIRRLSPRRIIRYSDQLPVAGSAEFKLLNRIYELYASSIKIRNFETLSMEITRKVIESNGAICTPGWILPKSQAFNKDFVVRMDIGNDMLTGIQLPVLGHSHCVRPTQVVNDPDMKHLYDVVKPGWVAVYVTTSYFSESVQKKAHLCEYPVILINGKTIAQIVLSEILINKLSLDEYLDLLEENSKFDRRDPDEVRSI